MRLSKEFLSGVGLTGVLSVVAGVIMFNLVAKSGESELDTASKEPQTSQESTPTPNASAFGRLQLCSRQPDTWGVVAPESREAAAALAPKLGFDVTPEEMAEGTGGVVTCPNRIKRADIEAGTDVAKLRVEGSLTPCMAFEIVWRRGTQQPPDELGSYNVLVVCPRPSVDIKSI